MKKEKPEQQEETIKTYKGFDKDLKCRGFQYETGKTYEHDGDIGICREGFHAISDKETPLSVFEYYPPVDENGNMSRYCEVETIGRTIREDNKVCCKKIKIGAEIGIPGIIKAHIEWVKKNLIDDDRSAAMNTGFRSAAMNTGFQSAAMNKGFQSAAMNTGDRSAAMNTGDRSAAMNTGFRSAAMNTGDQSAAMNTGFQSAAMNTGFRSAAMNTGDRSAAMNTGFRSAAMNTGFRSAAMNTGDRSAAMNTGDLSAAMNTGFRSAAEVSGEGSVAAVFGIDSMVRGSIGCAIFGVERGEWNGKIYPIISVCSAIVDGKKIKADTWYKVKEGKFVEAK